MQGFSVYDTSSKKSICTFKYTSDSYDQRIWSTFEPPAVRLVWEYNDRKMFAVCPFLDQLLVNYINYSPNDPYANYKIQSLHKVQFRGVIQAFNTFVNNKSAYQFVALSAAEDDQEQLVVYDILRGRSVFEIRKHDNPLTVQIQFIGLNDRKDASPAETNIFFIQGGSQVAFYDLRKSPTQPIRILTLPGYKKLQQPGQFIGRNKVLFGGERGGCLYDLKTG